MRQRIFTLAIEAVYLAAGSYWVYRALSEYEPLRAALRTIVEDFEEQARYRAAVQRTLAAIRHLPETPASGDDSVTGGTGAPEAGR